MSAAEYSSHRKRLLGAAAWNAYVARRGINASVGHQSRRENQAQLAALRMAYRKGAPE